MTKKAKRKNQKRKKPQPAHIVIVAKDIVKCRIGSTRKSNFILEILGQAFSRIEQYDLRVSHMYLNYNTNNRILKCVKQIESHGKIDSGKETWLYTWWSANVWLKPDLEDGEILLCGESFRVR